MRLFCASRENLRTRADDSRSAIQSGNPPTTVQPKLHAGARFATTLLRTVGIPMLFSEVLLPFVLTTSEDGVVNIFLKC